MGKNYIHLPAIASLRQLKEANTKNENKDRHDETDPYMRFDFTYYKNAIMVDIMQKRVNKMK